MKVAIRRETREEDLVDESVEKDTNESFTWGWCMKVFKL